MYVNELIEENEWFLLIDDRPLGQGVDGDFIFIIPMSNKMSLSNNIHDTNITL